MGNKSKFVFLAVLVLALLLPTAVLAAKPQEFEVSVRNRTGQPAELRVTGADGIHHMFNVPVGYSTITLPEGVHNYYAATACGNTAGNWNMSMKKTLVLDCFQTGAAAYLATKPEKACSDNGFFIWATYAPGSPWHYYSETNWDPTFPVSYDDHLSGLLQGWTIIEGCITDHSYSAYYNPWYVP